jgi:Zn finger protein HypA/HybF involved in hydrogenase expression
VIVDTISSTTVNILQEPVPTGGYYRAESKMITVPAKSTKYFDYTWPYLLSVLTLTFYTGPKNHNDIVNTFIGTQTTIGVVTKEAQKEDNKIHVNDTVISNIRVGFRVSVCYKESSVYVGECTAINKEAGTITLDSILQDTILSGALIQICVNNVKDFVLRANTTYELARKTIGASSLPPNTIVRVQYENTSDEETDFHFGLEYLY